MGTRLKERMEVLVPRLQQHLGRNGAELESAVELSTAEGFELGIPMSSLMEGRGHNSRRDDQLTAALNQALEENQFSNHPHPSRGDAPYAYVYTEERRVEKGRFSTGKEVMFRVHTNNPVMLAQAFPRIGERAIEIAAEMGASRGGGGASWEPAP